MFFYTDTGPRTPVNLSLIHNMDPNLQFNKHLENWFFLKFVLMSSKDWQEKAQATKELAICDRKLAYWKRNSKFDSKKATDETLKLKKKWNML